MTLVASGEISLLHATDNRCIVLEVFGSRINGKSILDCYNNANPAITPASGLGVALTDFYGHTQYGLGTIECQESCSFSPYARDNLGTQYAIPATYATAPNPMWNGEPTVTYIIIYKDASQTSFVVGDGVYVEGYRRTAGSSDSWGTPYLQLSYYASSQIAVDMDAYDYRFDVQDMP